jgi:magnesium-transporting ATPase (P-type)
MFPTNGGEALIIISAIALGLVILITPTQVLWVNMATAVTLAVALAFEPMERKTKPSNKPLVPLSMLARIGYVSCLHMAASLGMSIWYRNLGAAEEFARAITITRILRSKKSAP